MKECENCSKEFEPKNSWAKFCSTKCRTDNHFRLKYGINDRKTDENASVQRTINNHLTHSITDSVAIFDRLLNERESRINDKILLAQAEMKIQMLEQQLKDKDESSNFDMSKLIELFLSQSQNK